MPPFRSGDPEPVRIYLNQTLFSRLVEYVTVNIP